MATRSTISIENADGSVTGIYCHWDGYISNNGNILYNYYTHDQKIRTLLNLGNVSSLGALIGEQHPFDSPHRFGTPEYQEERAQWEGMTTFYGRDRGEQGQDAETYPSLKEFLDARAEEFNYHFKNGVWYVDQNGEGRFTKVEALLKESFTV